MSKQSSNYDAYARLWIFRNHVGSSGLMVASRALLLQLWHKQTVWRSLTGIVLKRSFEKLCVKHQQCL